MPHLSAPAILIDITGLDASHGIVVGRNASLHADEAPFIAGAGWAGAGGDGKG